VNFSVLKDLTIRIISSHIPSIVQNGKDLYREEIGAHKKPEDLWIVTQNKGLFTLFSSKMPDVRSLCLLLVHIV
jgi:hypothetical protein